MTLPDPIGEVLERDEDERRLRRNWEGTRARIAKRERKTSPRLGLAFASAALVGTVLLAWPRSNATGPLRWQSGEAPVAVESVATPRTLAFEDGSTLELGVGGRVVPRRNDARRFDLALERGRARFEVTPGGPRTWTVDAGLATVRVIGTAFVVERRERELRVEVERGRVRVEGEHVPGGQRELGAGESIVVRAAESVAPSELDAQRAERAESAEVLDETALELDETALEELDETADETARAERVAGHGASAWQRLAERGEHRAAYEALSPVGLAHRARAASARELLLLADVARLSGHPQDAVGPLRRFLTAHGAHPEAPLAAITLARIEVSLGRPGEAADAFERARTLGVPSAFDAEVCSGLALARARSGDVARASEEARDCLGRHARPPHAEALRRLATDDADETEGADVEPGSDPHTRTPDVTEDLAAPETRTEAAAEVDAR